MLASTGRDSRVKHVTGKNGKKLKENGPGYPHPLASTGQDSSICHSTGRPLEPERREEPGQAKMKKGKQPQIA